MGQHEQACIIPAPDSQHPMRQTRASPSPHSVTHRPRTRIVLLSCLNTLHSPYPQQTHPLVHMVVYLPTSPVCPKEALPLHAASRDAQLQVAAACQQGHLTWAHHTQA